jgi:flagellar assembly protein FliH
MTTGDVAKPEKKYFFNAHVFDKNGVDLVELAARNAAPPPPVFSEAEMERARKQAFAEGQLAAERAYMASHEQRMATLLEMLQKNLGQFFTNESLRETLYEREAVNLTMHVFEQLFPATKAAFGFEELKAGLEKTITAYNGKGVIRIFVHSEMLAGVSAFIEKLGQNAPELRLSVAAEDTLDPMASRISWENGGCLRDTQTMAQEIRSLLQESLAAYAPKGHDDNAEASENGETR